MSFEIERTSFRIWIMTTMAMPMGMPDMPMHEGASG